MTAATVLYTDPTTGRSLRNPWRENSEFAKFSLRILRSLSRRAANDVDALPAIAELRDGLDELMRQSISQCLEQGYSWADIAQRLGVTKQAAWERYHRRPTATRATR